MYYTTIATDMPSALAEIVSICQMEGWSWDSGTSHITKLSPKGSTISCRLELVNGNSHIRVWPNDPATATQAPYPGYFGPLTGHSNHALTWPIVLHVFCFDYEVYVWARHTVNNYIWMAFGQSQIGGIPGTGNWGAAIACHAYYAITVRPNQGFYVVPSSSSTGGLFWLHSSIPNSHNSYMHHGFTESGDPWAPFFDERRPAPYWVGNSFYASAGFFTGTPVLFPLRWGIERGSGYASLCFEAENLRILRSSVLDEETIITYGDDDWMVLPWLKLNRSVPGGGAGHSGNAFAAIRYQTEESSS